MWYLCALSGHDIPGLLCVLLVSISALNGRTELARL